MNPDRLNMGSYENLVDSCIGGGLYENLVNSYGEYKVDRIPPPPKLVLSEFISPKFSLSGFILPAFTFPKLTSLKIILSELPHTKLYFPRFILSEFITPQVYIQGSFILS